MPRDGDGAETPRSKPQSPLRITHDGEFYARLLTKESGASQGDPPSFRYYGAGPGVAVPFVWETHPGTPKDADSSAATAVLPAITPPPSYHLRAAVGPHGHGKATGGRAKYCGYYKLNKWINKTSFIATVFRRLAFGKPAARSSSSSPAASTTKSSSTSTRWLFSASGAADDLQEYCYNNGPPPKTTKGMLCLGVRPSSSWMVRFCGGGRREPARWVYG